jgi:O-antigen ligase
VRGTWEEGKRGGSKLPVAERVWAAAIVAFLVLAPWQNGLASPWNKALWAAVVFLLAATMPRSRFPIPRRWLLALILVAVLPLLQVLPLPASVIAALSPARGEAAAVVIKAAGEAGLPSGTGRPLGGVPLSYFPYQTLRGVLLLLASAAWILATAVFFSRRGRARPFLAASAMLGIALSGAVILARVGAGSLAPSPETALWAPASLPFVNKNHLATLLSVLALLQIGGLGTGRRFCSSRLRLLLATAFPVTLAGLLAAGSRGAVFAFLAGAVILGLSHLRGIRPMALAPILVALAMTPLVVELGVGGEMPVLEEQMNERTMIIRRSVWTDTWRMASEHLPFGAGLGSFEQLYPRYQQPGLLFRINSAHNEPLQWLAETGPLPTMILLAGVVGLVMIGIREGRESRSFRGRLAPAMGAAIAAAGVHSLIDFPLRNPAVALWVLAAVGFLLAREMRRGAEGKEPAGKMDGGDGKTPGPDRGGTPVAGGVTVLDSPDERPR